MNTNDLLSEEVLIHQDGREYISLPSGEKKILTLPKKIPKLLYTVVMYVAKNRVNVIRCHYVSLLTPR